MNPSLLLRDATVQEIQLELLPRTKFNDFDGERVCASLLKHPSLRTHKLRGPLSGCWACSAGFDLRIIFEFVQHEGAEAILLLALGTHDQVY